MGSYIYLNGDFIAKEEAKVSVFDRGFLYGDGLFETMRVYSGRVFLLDDHLSRLFNSAHQLGIRLSDKKEKLQSAVERLIELNTLSDASVRITVSRGIHTGVLTLNDAYTPTVVITAKEVTPYPQDYYTHGVKAIISTIRKNSYSPLPLHKSMNYLDNILAKEEAGEKGCFEAILLNSEGRVAEGATSNIFVVKDKKVFTPPVSSHILPGVTRKIILSLIPRLRFTAEEKRITPEDIFSSDEVFLTNSIMEAMPVIQVNSSVIGAGRPGPVWEILWKGYRDLVKKTLS